MIIVIKSINVENGIIAEDIRGAYQNMTSTLSHENIVEFDKISKEYDELMKGINKLLTSLESF